MTEVPVPTDSAADLEIDRPLPRSHGHAAALVVMLLSGGVPLAPVAADTVPEARFVFRDLIAWLPGHYTNAPQVFLERELGTPPAGPHDFASVTISLVSETDNGAEFSFDPPADHGSGPVRTPGVVSATFDDQAGAVRMALPGTGEPSVDALTGSGCMLEWRRLGRQLRGVARGSKCADSDRTVDWQSEWILDDEQLWIVASAARNGSHMAGRDDGSHLRLFKSRRYECFASFQFADGSTQVVNPFFMHDRGDRFIIRTEEANPRTIYLELMLSLWPSRSGRNFRELLRLTMQEGDPDDDIDDPQIGYGWAGRDSDRVGWATDWASARCKRTG